MGRRFHLADGDQMFHKDTAKGGWITREHKEGQHAELKVSQ
jgi:hypothetical protein